MEISLDVRGTAHRTVTPERAVVSAAVRADGPQADDVKATVATVLAQVRDGLDALAAAGAVARYSVAQVWVTQHRPWNDQGEQLPLVHTATAAVTAEFADWTALGRWVLTEGLLVHGVQWELTETTRREVERRVRQEALRDAVTRAQDYADTLQLGEVRIRAVRDPGVAAEPMPRRLMAAMADSGGPELDLTPEPLAVTAEVHATFGVRPGPSRE